MFNDLMRGMIVSFVDINVSDDHHSSLSYLCIIYKLCKLFSPYTHLNSQLIKNRTYLIQCAPMTWLAVAEHLGHKDHTYVPFVLIAIHILVSSFMICHLICNISNTFHMWSSNCSPARSTCIHPRFLAGFVLLDLQFSMGCFIDRCLYF